MLAASIIFCSCQKKASNSLNITHADSLETIQSQSKAENIGNHYTDEEQKKVIGKIKFGEDESTVKRKLDKFIKESSREKFKNFSQKYPFIGNYEFSTDQNSVKFFDDQLYFMRLQGRDINYENYDEDVPKELGYIIDVIKKQYGDPYDAFPMVRWTDTKDDFSYLICYWKIGVKEIDLRVNDHGQHYTIDVDIFKPATDSIVRRLERLGKEKITSEATNVF
jgi:hypothetical protein